MKTLAEKSEIIINEIIERCQEGSKVVFEPDIFKDQVTVCIYPKNEDSCYHTHVSIENLVPILYRWLHKKGTGLL